MCDSARACTHTYQLTNYIAFFIIQNEVKFSRNVNRFTFFISNRTICGWRRVNELRKVTYVPKRLSTIRCRKTRTKEWDSWCYFSNYKPQIKSCIMKNVLQKADTSVLCTDLGILVSINYRVKRYRNIFKLRFWQHQ